MGRPSIESLFDATIVVDASGRVRSFSASAEQTFGRTVKQATGQFITDLVPQFHAREAEGRWRTPAVYADGTLFPVEVAAWSEADPDRTVVLIRDLTEHGLQSAPDEGGWWEVNLHTQEVVWSPRTFALHGVTPEEFTPTADAVMPLIEPEDRPGVLAALETLLAGKATAPFEYRLARPPGGVRVLRMTMFNDRSAAQGMPHGVIHDVTAQRLTRARLDTHQAIANTLFNWEIGKREIRGLLQRLFLTMSWRIAAVWVPEGETLTCRAFVAETGMEVEAFEQAVRNVGPIAGDATLCGRAWTERTAQAVVDIGESSLPIAEVSRQAGIRGGLALPAVHGDEMIAVFELFTTERRDLEPEMLDTFNAVGRQLGSFLATHRSLLAPALVTARELEILRHAAEGESVREIAERLVISPATVKTHLQNIYGKLGVNDRPAAVAVALRTGLIT